MNRDPTDLYPTDPHWTRSILSAYPFTGPVWECAAGEGNIVKVLQDSGFTVHATDILTGIDFLKCIDPWEGSIITNPPYKLLDEFVHRALSLATQQVAMLLPVGGLGGQVRCENLWRKIPPAKILIIARRMTVRGKMSQFNHVWAVWDKIRTGPTTIEWRR